MSSLPQPDPTPTLDLTEPAPLTRDAERLDRISMPSSRIQTVEACASEDVPRERVRRLIEVFRSTETVAIVESLQAAAKLAVRQEPAGLRMWFDFLQVKRPGVEVLQQIQQLSSLERVSMRVVKGTWTDPEGPGQTNAVFSILEVLETATELGILDLGLEILPAKPEALRELYNHVRIWFRTMEPRLEREERLEPAAIGFIAHLAILEIGLLEKRVSHVAGRVDPYDVRGMARLMPILSRYDQDIEHMKTVASKLTTYEPFFDRLISMEHALTTKEMDKIQKLLLADTLTSAPGRVLRAMRDNPILDREFAFLVSLVHQIATLRSQVRAGGQRPDVLSILLQVLENGRGGTGFRLVMEPEVADEIWPTVQTWGVLRRGPDCLEIAYREDRALDFVLPDGTPKLPDVPEGRSAGEIDIKEMIRLQLSNEAFILGILDNQKVTGMPGVVGMIVSMCRSLRVMDRVMRDRSLYTGPSNKEVPKLLLTSPSRVPLRALQRFIHVRFVSRVDLERLARRGSEVRNEVRREIERYLENMKK